MGTKERSNPADVIEFINTVMLPKGATEGDVDEYAMSEGYTYDELSEFHQSGSGKPTYPDTPEDYRLGEFSNNPELDRAMADRDHKLLIRQQQFQKGETDVTQLGMSAAAHSLGKGLDYAMGEVVDTTKGIAGLASAMYNQYAPEGVKDYAKSEGEALGSGVFQMQHKLGVDRFLSENWDDIKDWWNELPQETRRFAEEVGIVGSITPQRQIAKVVGDVASKTTGGIGRKLLKNVVYSDFDKTIDFIRPRKTGKYLEEVEERTNAARKYTPSEEEVRLANTAKKTKGFKAGGNDFKNKDAIIAREAHLNSKLDTDLRKYGTEVSESQLSTMSHNLDNLVKGKSKFNDNKQGLTGDKKAAEHLSEIRRQIQKKADIENNGVIDSRIIDSVRKDLGKEINFNKPKADKFNPDNEILRNIYNSLNDVVDATTHGRVKRTRADLSDVIKIKKNVVSKLSRTAQDAIGDALNVIGKGGRLKWALRQLTDIAVKAAPVGAAAVLGGQGAGVATALAGAGVGAMWVAGKAGSSRGGRVFLYKLVDSLNKAAKVAKSAEEIVKIKRSKTTILKMIAAQQATSQKEEKLND